MRKATKKLYDELIEEGIKAILKNGVEGFSIRAVAETCQVSCATPFKHFKGKENYFAKMAEKLDGMLLERMEQLEIQWPDDYKQAHMEMSLAYIQYLMEYPFLINTSFWRIINEKQIIGIRDWRSFQKMIEQFKKYCYQYQISEEKEKEYYFFFQTFAYGTAFVIVSELRKDDGDLEQTIRKIQSSIYLDMEKNM